VSKPLDPALLFWCTHWDEMTSLASRVERPPNVASSDWDKFREVVEHATHGAVNLLSTLAEPLEQEGFGDGILYRKRSNRRTMEEHWICEGAVALGERRKERDVGKLWFGIAREREPLRPVFVVAFYFATNGGDVGARYVQLARDAQAERPSNLMLKFASEVIEEAGRWSLLLSMTPIDATTTIDSLRDELIATARSFAATQDQLSDALGEG
jgi:hypothetical protein